MSLFAARMKKIQSKMKNHFSNDKSMGIFSDAQRQLIPQIEPKYKLVRDFMAVLLTCKNENDPIKNKGAKELTRLIIH